MEKCNKFILLTLVIVIFLCGCTTFRYFPEGVWICDELSITINFDNKDVQVGSYNGKGTIIIDEEEKEIACGMDATGSAIILYVDEVGKDSSERTSLYIGTFKHKGDNEMTFKMVRSKKKYIFVKQK